MRLWISPTTKTPRLARRAGVATTRAEFIRPGWRRLGVLTACAVVGFALVSCRTAPLPGQSHYSWPESPFDSAHEARPVDQPPSLPAPDRTGPPAGIAIGVPAHPRVVAEELPASPPAPAATALRGHLYHEVPVDGPYIALTFDDGPSPRLTPALLNILKQRGIRATFFVVGERAAAYPDILRRMSAEGHEIANHTWDHPALTRLNLEALRWQIGRTGDAIEAAIGHAPSLVRPPYGATNPDLNRLMAEELGLTVVLWSVDSLDWKLRDSKQVKDQILAGTRPGAIILAHDIHASTIAAMPATLDRLHAQGYRFVTVSELIALEQSR